MPFVICYKIASRRARGASIAIGANVETKRTLRKSRVSSAFAAGGEKRRGKKILMDGIGSAAERKRPADSVTSRCNAHLPDPPRVCHRVDPSPAMLRLGSVYLSNLRRRG